MYPRFAFYTANSGISSRYWKKQHFCYVSPTIHTTIRTRLILLSRHFSTKTLIFLYQGVVKSSLIAQNYVFRTSPLTILFFRRLRPRHLHELKQAHGLLLKSNQPVGSNYSSSVFHSFLQGAVIVHKAPLITFTIPLSDTSTNEILEGQFKPLKSIIHFENGWYPFPQKPIYNMYRYNTTQCDIFQQYKLYQTVLEYIFVTFTILGTLFPMG